MADRYFPNVMPDFVAETPPPTTVTGGEEEIVAQGTQESLMRLLSMPYATLSKRLMRAALDLKETVRTLLFLSLYVDLSVCICLLRIYRDDHVFVKMLSW